MTMLDQPILDELNRNDCKEYAGAVMFWMILMRARQLVQLQGACEHAADDSIEPILDD